MGASQARQRRVSLGQRKVQRLHVHSFLSSLEGDDDGLFEETEGVVAVGEVVVGVVVEVEFGVVDDEKARRASAVAAIS